MSAARKLHLLQPQPDEIQGSMEDFLETTLLPRLNDRKPSSITKYKDTLKLWQRAVGDVPLAEVNSRHAQAFYAQLLNTPGRFGAQRLADWSIKHHLGRMQRILRIAVSRKLLAEVPEFPRHRVDHDKKIKKHWITPDELELILACCHLKRKPRLPETETAHWWQALLYLTWWTAARISQMFDLLWTDIAGDVLTIRPKRKRAKHARYVVLDRRAEELLDRLDRNHERVFYGLAPNANLSRHFERLCEWAGIELGDGSAWHSLRRGRCAQEFALGGIHYAQERLGHADLETTEESYLHEQVRRSASIDRQRVLLKKAGVEGAVQESAPAEPEFANRVQLHLAKARSFLQSGDFDECAVRCRRAVEAWVKRWVRRVKLRIAPGASLFDRVLALRANNVIDDEAVRLLRYSLPKAGCGAHDDKQLSPYSAAEVLRQITYVCGSDQLGEFAGEIQATAEALDQAGIDAEEIERAASRDHFLNGTRTWRNLRSSAAHRAALPVDDADKLEAMAGDWALRCSLDEYRGEIDRIIGAEGHTVY